jgi:hypothetical protein
MRKAEGGTRTAEDGMPAAAPVPVREHRFAWDGYSFCVPADWNLSQYRFGHGHASVRMEDSEALRLEFEWTRPRGEVDARTVRERYLRRARALASAAAESSELADLPQAWSGFLYRMPDGRQCLSAFRFFPQAPLFGLLRLHFGAEDRLAPRRVLAALCSSFVLHDASVPWEVYDVAFRVGREFRLVATAFQAGCKLMVFQWRLRRLHVWQFSLAESILKDGSPAEFGADFLNRFKGINGPRFRAESAETIASRRRRRYPCGHFEELGRWCFRYRAGCAHLPGKNALALWVFQYRRESDLAKLEESFVPPADG